MADPSLSYASFACAQIPPPARVEQNYTDITTGLGPSSTWDVTVQTVTTNLTTVAAPTTYTASAGSRIILSEQVTSTSATTLDMTIGTDGSTTGTGNPYHMWFTVPVSGAGFRFYAGASSGSPTEIVRYGVGGADFEVMRGRAKIYGTSALYPVTIDSTTTALIYGTNTTATGLMQISAETSAGGTIQLGGGARADTSKNAVAIYTDTGTTLTALFDQNNKLILGDTTDRAPNTTARQLVLESSAANNSGINMLHGAASNASEINWHRALGSLSAPIVISAGKVEGQITAWGYDGSAYKQSGALDFTANGTIIAGRVPGAFNVWLTADSDGSLNRALSIDSAYLGTFKGSVVIENSSLTVGKAGTATGSVLYKGTTSGTVTTTVAAAAGTWTLTLPTTAGSVSGQLLQTDGTGVTSWTTASFPSASASAGKIIISDGTNWVASTPTWPTSASTAGKVVVSDGTNLVMSTPTFPNASATSGKVIVSDGTNWIASTPTFPNASASSGKIIISDGTNWTASTPTYPNTSGTNTKWLKADGTNVVYSTTTLVDSWTQGDLVTATSATALGAIAAVASGSILTSAGASTVPAYSTTLTLNSSSIPNFQTLTGAQFSVSSNTANNRIIGLAGYYSANATQGFAIARSGSATLGTLAYVASGHKLGALFFMGADTLNSQFTIGSQIIAITGAAWSDTDHDTYLQFFINPSGATSTSEKLRLRESVLSPGANDGTALGSTSLQWSDLFLASGAVINFNSGNMTVTHAAGVLTIGGGTLAISDSSTNTGLATLYAADNASPASLIRINATQANITTADVFMNFSSTSGVEGSIAGTGIAGVIAYNTFTGSHWSQSDTITTYQSDKTSLTTGKTKISFACDLEPGTVLVSTDNMSRWKGEVANHLPRCKVSDKPRDKAVYGVFGGVDDDGDILVLALGAGKVLVCDEGGPIEIGDFLCTSSLPGYAMRYDGDDMRVVLGKARHAFSGTSGLIPVTYLCG